MKVIREKCNAGSYSPPLLKEISSRDLRKEGESTRNDERCIDYREKRILGQSDGGEFLDLSSNFLPLHMGDRAL
jgi:hypothetical protein